MDEAMKDLKDGLITQVDAYISDTLQQWVICEVSIKFTWQKFNNTRFIIL